MIKTHATYTWHGTCITSNIIDNDTFVFYFIIGLYRGDQSAFPLCFTSSTGILSALCYLRASKTVLNKLNKN